MISTYIKNLFYNMAINAALNTFNRGFINQHILQKLTDTDNIKMIRIKADIHSCLYTDGFLYSELYDFMYIENAHRIDTIGVVFNKRINFYDTHESALIGYQSYADDYPEDYDIKVENNKVIIIYENNDIDDCQDELIDFHEILDIITND